LRPWQLYDQVATVTGAANGMGQPIDSYRDFAWPTALGRFVDEPDIAEAVRFPVGDSRPNLTGQDIVVDVGWSV
jgi:hypothetical protein